MAQLTKEQIAEVFESIAQMLELKGENVFKIRAYTNAARALEIYTGDLTAAVGEGRLDEIAGVGKAIADKITELVATGQLAFFERLKAEFPPGIFEMFEVQGLGPKKLKHSGRSWKSSRSLIWKRDVATGGSLTLRGSERKLRRIFFWRFKRGRSTRGGIVSG